MKQSTQTHTPGSVCGYEYTVKRGDSFYLIAHRLGIPLRSLLEANADINPARLTIGDVLCIPTEEDDAVNQPAQEQTPATEEAEAVCQETEEELPGMLTQLDEPDDLLDHPASAQEGGQSEAPSDAQAEQPPATDESAVPCDRYTVASGETAADVLISHDLNLRTLERANPDTDLSTLHGGETICLPRENIPCNSMSGYTLQSDDTLESVALRMDVSVGSLLRANPCIAPSGFRAGTVIVIPRA